MHFFKKTMILLISFLITAIIVFYFYSYVNGPTIKAQSAILIDAASGEIIYKKNEDIPLPSVSLSKMMTEYIVLEHIHEGTIKWDDRVKISKNALHTAGENIDITTKDRITVRDLFHAMILASDNIAAVSLAEHISKNEQRFTGLMNEKAKQLQLSSDSYFINATGLTNEQNKESKMTALDASKLAQHVIKDYPFILEMTQLTSYKFTFKDIHVFNTNKMLYSLDKKVKFKGVEGLQTSFTNAAGYSFTGTAKQGNKRLISVVMGTSGEDSMFIETKKLFTYGFKPSQNSSLQSLKNFAESWTCLLQFKNLFLQIVTFLVIILGLLFLHTRMKNTEDF
ncbi:D-alanyl-D-alanine carboxypeptidase family protein [Bacillus sp. DX1.1]|uniref:D-alanyl-D-alanine carboxypeptidase family protein n=1 Tax=unclassified Bacillus (in: firmicutes) TaxID=185979 RepID=UPI0025711951|nr:MULTISPECIES: D-alanyl-D-alanine carboxypeptidase family protein [unclassified Bacillus (in: firmicutes)]MDM5154993.1 D-alanyl-D-alanine carboxypeptidase family protein [Bacillus sp. DX1.1]WJE83856.1 D-alanyl-D-alanine carboxypeptidase family protein [Bacillus sp. DX3.1]